MSSVNPQIDIFAKGCEQCPLRYPVLVQMHRAETAAKPLKIIDFQARARFMDLLPDSDHFKQNTVSAVDEAIDDINPQVPHNLTDISDRIKTLGEKVGPVFQSAKDQVDAQVEHERRQVVQHISDQHPGRVVCDNGPMKIRPKRIGAKVLYVCTAQIEAKSEGEEDCQADLAELNKKVVQETSEINRFYDLFHE